MLVDEGNLPGDKPIRDSVPEIQFYNDQLNSNVTLRDMLSHRTGVTRHDLIWFKSPFTREELFKKLKYLEPQEPIRTTRSEEHTSELQSRLHLVCRLLLDK